MEKNLKEHPTGGIEETYRREFITASDRVKLLEREVYELQKQLQDNHQVALPSSQNQIINY